MLLSGHSSCKGQDVTKTREIDKMEMIYVIEGSFQRGSNDEQIDQVIEECLKMYP